MTWDQLLEDYEVNWELRCREYKKDAVWRIAPVLTHRASKVVSRGSLFLTRHGSLKLVVTNKKVQILFAMLPGIIESAYSEDPRKEIVKQFMMETQLPFLVLEQ